MIRKILFSLICLFFAVVSFSQSFPQPPYSPNSPTGKAYYGYLLTDSAAGIARRDTSWTASRAGLMVYWLNAGVDTSLWVSTGRTSGKKWAKVESNSTGQYVLVADTSAMLLPYLRKSDTLTMLLPYLRKSDTASMLSGYALNGRVVKYSDTTSMLSGYARNGQVVKYSDTSTMLSPYARTSNLHQGAYLDTGRATSNLSTGGSLNKVRDSLVGLISGGWLGTVLNVSTTDGVGIISSVANPTSTPNISLRVDTLTIATRLHVDSVAMRKLNISDTATMLSNLLRISDTATMLSNRLKISDTTTMLSPFVQYSDTANQMSGYLRKNFALLLQDTATAFSVRPLNNRFLDSIATIRALANTKGVGTVTSVGLSMPSIFSVTNSPVTSSGTLTASLATQSANTVFSGPTTGSPATPTFRALVAADIPSLPYVPSSGTLTNRRIPFVNASGELKDTTGFTWDATGLSVPGDIYASSAYLDNNLSLGMSTGLGTLTVRKTTAAQAAFYGFSDYGPNRAGSGKIILGSNGLSQGLIQYYDGGNTTLYVENTYDNDSAAIIFRIRSLGTPVNVLTLYGESKAVFADTVVATAFVKNGGTSSQILLADGGTISTSSYGSVSSIATNNGTGINGGTITTTGTLAIDTVNVSTRLWRQKGIDSVVGLVNLKLNISDTSTMFSNYVQKASTLTSRRMVFVDGNGRLKDTTGFTWDATGLSIPGDIYGEGGNLNTTLNIGITSGTGYLKIKKTNGEQGLFYGYSQLGSGRDGSGEIILGSNTSYQGILDFYDGGNTSLNIINSYDNANAAINFKLRTTGTPVTALSLVGSGAATFISTVTGSRFIGSSAADNTIDAIQSGGGSILSNLYRMEGKIQATSVTIDATATVWNDNTNGSTVTYTLPATASLTGGFFGFIKTGTGNLTLSGTIVKKDGTSAGGSLTLASTDGLQWFWFNGSTWYQSN